MPPVFTQDMNNLALSEATPVGTKVYKLEGFDPEGSDVVYGLIGSDNFMVNPTTGDVEIVKPLDREVLNEHFCFIFSTYDTFIITATRHPIIFGHNKRPT